jgi:hypothetical protein
MITWARYGGYECSSKGDTRFSPFYATMRDGRTIEEWYQCEIKGYDPGGTDWRKGKGRPSLIEYPGDNQWRAYLLLWKSWAKRNPELMLELLDHAREHKNTLSDRFATTPINQARALATILNESFGG